MSVIVVGLLLGSSKTEDACVEDLDAFCRISTEVQVPMAVRTNGDGVGRSVRSAIGESSYVVELEKGFVRVGDERSGFFAQLAMAGGKL